MPLLILIALFAIADFAVLFTLGARLGLLASLLWIIVSGALGIHLIRRESLLTLQRARVRVAAGEIPSDEIMAGASFVLAGILLIAPGFLSDIVGLICLIPGSGQLWRRWSARSSGGGSKGAEIPGDWNVHRRDSEQAANNGRASDGASPLEGEYLGKDQ